MKFTRAIIVFLLLFCSGCQSFNTHPRMENLSSGEIRYVLNKFKVYMSQLGLVQTFRSGKLDTDYARFEINGAPLREYIDLSYEPENGFILKITRITVQSPGISEKGTADIRLKTEQFVSEATSKNVQIRVFVELP